MSSASSVSCKNLEGMDIKGMQEFFGNSSSFSGILNNLSGARRKLLHGARGRLGMNRVNSYMYTVSSWEGCLPFILQPAQERDRLLPTEIRKRQN